MQTRGLNKNPEEGKELMKHSLYSNITETTEFQDSKEELVKAEGSSNSGNMSIASSQQSFLANALLPLLQTPITKPTTYVATVSCRYPPADEHKDASRKNEKKLAKLAIVTLATGVLTLGSVGDASAAKSGGRVGGQAFRSSGPRSAPRINNNSRTNIYVNPPVAPPLVGGYGYGFGVPFYGGWGWSPFSFFAPGPSVAIGIGGGFETFVLFILLGSVAAVIRKFLKSRDEDEY